MRLSPSAPRHWGPISEVVDFVARKCGSGKVLEIGPGHAPFMRANLFVDFADTTQPPGPLYKADIATQPLPFPDKSIDFVYARHILEDMWNPFHLIKEMERVAKSGYIETPSPIAELCRGVDGGWPPFRGYHHHRWIVWNHDGTLKVLTKYPVIEYLDIDEVWLTPLLSQPKFWNTYLLWEDKIPVRHIQSPLDYDIPRDYRRILDEAVDASINSTVPFFSQFGAKAA